MKIILTENAEENLWQLYKYHADYSPDYADAFQHRISSFIFSILTEHPKIGILYNEAKNLYRIIYKGRYNIYYVFEKDALYIVYILDGRLQLNTEMAGDGVALPPLD